MRILHRVANVVQWICATDDVSHSVVMKSINSHEYNMKANQIFVVKINIILVVKLAKAVEGCKFDGSRKFFMNSSPL